MRVGQILDGFMIVVNTAQRDVLLSGPTDIKKWPPLITITEHVI